MGRREGRGILCGIIAASMALLLAGCAKSADEPAAANHDNGNVPAKTVRVYLATALACSRLNEFDARFTPLKVTGRGYSTSVKPVEGCKEQAIFSSYVYDVPVSASGTVEVTPGNQPAADVDVAKVAASGAVTIFYAADYGDQFKVTVTKYEKDEAVSAAK